MPSRMMWRWNSEYPNRVVLDRHTPESMIEVTGTPKLQLNYC